MSDILTQLQESMDLLCTMFIAGLYYVERHHDLKQFTPADKIPDLKADQPKEVDTLDPQTFKDGQVEISRDLIYQAQRIEYLVSELPGLQNSERDQLRIIQGLEEEIAGLEAQRQEAVRERDEVFAQLDALVRSLQRP
ncbi:CSE2-domain-containing protein [Parathielavia appendiculata]|uniref:Mediator of RNA polymerase II transcription subunit 21 n=1 Tax=Parathielavia appendiculata TaxID=2587402 RepID=A0AAN6U5P6_9PEZI|nr:CSE2-domain-containing protein [Parathielavia appendiculata]